MDQQSALRDQLAAMHAVAAGLAVFLKERQAYCRFCKLPINLRTPKRGHDPLCPLVRIMRGDIPVTIQRSNDDAWEKETPMAPPHIAMVSSKTIAENNYNLTAEAYLDKEQHASSRHTLQARMDGDRVVVTDAQGQPVEALFGATNDLRTVSAYVDGIGFIGGWQYPHRSMPWAYLADSINAGLVYHTSSALPVRYASRRICPHCGGSLA